MTEEQFQKIKIACSAYKKYCHNEEPTEEERKTLIELESYDSGTMLINYCDSLREKISEVEEMICFADIHLDKFSRANPSAGKDPFLAIVKMQLGEATSKIRGEESGG